MKITKTGGPFPFTVFLGAFLLFQIQPIIGKYFLPWFGGAPAVWLTCLMFFQLLLLGGYTYAHFLQRLPSGRQSALHVGLLVAALVTGGLLVFAWGSPILPGASWRPVAGSERPTADILRLLLISVGLSYFLLSTSASLLQAWSHRIQPERSPYIFYVVSNTASLLALLSYPFVVEPHLTIREQAWIWSGGFLIYAVLCAVCSSMVRNVPEIKQKECIQSETHSKRHPILWTLLSFGGVLALMAVTNQMTQDIPPVPFLWILPLSIYLLSYILGFMEKLRGWQDVYVYLLLCAFGAAWYLMRGGLELEIRNQIAAYSFILLAICLFCHNALYRAKPDPKHLTGFYLCISLGGALGGLFTVLAAPFLFKGYWEYQLVLILSGALAVYFIYTDAETRKTFRVVRHAFPVLLAAFAVFLGSGIVKELRRSVYIERNFFGCVRVAKEINNGIPIYSLLHGKINHGMQIDHPKFRTRPTTYFTANSGVGLAMQLKQQNPEPMRVGILGLGIGTLAVYGRTGDVYRLYEIDPAVIKLAQNSPWFSFLKDSKAGIEVVQGDGRISLERDPANRFDVLVLDAFTGDSPPAHLLTLEAFGLYLNHLADGGVIAVNISNRYLDLLPVLVQVRNHFNLNAAYITTPGDMKISANAQWVLLSRDAEWLRQPAIAQVDSLKNQMVRDIRPWTDDYSNLLSVMK
ncbi:MAG: fused MFS/spermidine synthase [Kiritimatiellaceae bacterium]|nr:fused MFS/spermidine synthase [Kiritimatiellaceae bacterium]